MLQIDYGIRREMLTLKGMTYHMFSLLALTTEILL